jgi:hypothetical protein
VSHNFMTMGSRQRDCKNILTLPIAEKIPLAARYTPAYVTHVLSETANIMYPAAPRSDTRMMVISLCDVLSAIQQVRSTTRKARK